MDRYYERLATTTLEPKRGWTGAEVGLNVWRELLAGNAMYVAGAPHCLTRTNIHKAREESAKSQAPPAAIVGCSDSRVVPELIFNQGFGDVFTVMCAGNLADAHGVGSLEFGTMALGVKVLVVLGHTACGACKAGLEATKAGE